MKAQHHTMLRLQFVLIELERNFYFLLRGKKWSSHFRARDMSKRIAHSEEEVHKFRIVFLRIIHKIWIQTEAKGKVIDIEIQAKVYTKH